MNTKELTEEYSNFGDYVKYEDHLDVVKQSKLEAVKEFASWLDVEQDKVEFPYQVDDACRWLLDKYIEEEL